MDAKLNPEHFEVDAALEAMEHEDEREKEALRMFYEREAGENVIRRGWRWLRDRWLWLRWFSWQ